MPNAKNPSAKVRVSHSKAPTAAPIVPRAQTITQYLAQLNARPDPIDFRDLMFEPTLVEVPPHITLDEYRAKYRQRKPLILNQFNEGACTGFGLAAVAHFLLHRRAVDPDPTPVSPRMFYEMARRYDEWPGEAYSGSSARGAMKGWHKHGVCSSAAWPYVPAAPGGLTNDRAQDAARRPLGAYFRVNHRNLVAMHAALAEVGILYATGTVHEGWTQIGPNGVIPGPEKKAILGGHAFAIVGYDQRGFWVQNSWGTPWGLGGFALVTYADWLTHGSDVWVARLGAPVAMSGGGLVTVTSATQGSRLNYSFSDVRPHLIGLGNDGLLRSTGEIGTTPADVEEIFRRDFPRLTSTWSKKRILLYAHGGLVGEKGAIQRVADYRQPLLDAEVYPLAFIWKTDLWTTLGNMLEDVLHQRKPEGLFDSAKDFLLDRLDDTLEVIAKVPGEAVWGEMKENALAAMNSGGGAERVFQHLQALLKADPAIEIHVAGHSAGAIFMARLVAALADVTPVRSCTLWAPACTIDLFDRHYLPAIRSGAIRDFTLFTLKDGSEQDDDCAKIYHKSLLYLVSRACETSWPIPFVDGTPLLGLERFLFKDPRFGIDRAAVLKANPATVPILGLPNATWVRAPNGLPEGSPDASNSRHHGDFDDDHATVKATLARVLKSAGTAKSSLQFTASASALAHRRRGLDAAIG